MKDAKSFSIFKTWSIITNLSIIKTALVNELQYPEEMLKFQYDPDLTIRGLHYDITNGLLIKVNAVLQIQSDAVFRGIVY